MKQPSLYDILLGDPPDGFPLHAVSENTQVILSVFDNMQRILDTRTGSLKHLPDHGLLDMAKILQGIPGTAHQLISTFSQVLLKYEPQLKDTQIAMQEQGMPEYLRYFIDVGPHDLGTVRYGANFTPEGRVPICHLKEQGWFETGVYRHGKESHQH